MEDRYDSADGQGQGIWSLYVGLFIVLLSFFIMLVGSSRTDIAITSGVGESPRMISKAETSRPRRQEDAFTPLGDLGGELAGLLRSVGGARAERDEELLVALPVSELFAPDGAELRSESTPFIDRVAAVLGAPPPASRLEVRFSLDRPDAEQREELALALRRDEAFARALVARGAPPSAIAIGVAPDQSGLALLAFRYRAGDSASSEPAR